MNMTKIPFGFKYQTKAAKHNSPTGLKIQMEHRGEIDLKGRRHLVRDVEKPIYEMIQASREQTEIERIVKRALEGDPTVLQAREGQYTDITEAPKSIAEAQQAIINAKRNFEKLDPETKKKFENNVEIFIATAGSKEWCDKMGITAKLERKKAAEEAQAKFEADMAAGMANLAGMNAIVNTGIEGEES